MTTTTETVTIDLTVPIQREGEPVDRLFLRKPKAGELRGLKVEDLFATDVNTLFALLPRICTPFLTPQEIDDLESEDLLEIAGAVKGFFMPAAMKEAMAKVLGG